MIGLWEPTVRLPSDFYTDPYSRNLVLPDRSATVNELGGTKSDLVHPALYLTLR